MLRGIYSAGTAMLTQRKKMDVITNNIANTNTVGFKEDEMISQSFKDMIISKVDDPSIVNSSYQVGPLNTGIHIDKVITNFESGAFDETGKSTDFAINGNGFFVVDTPQGLRYTKDGTFNINQEGFLVNQDGFNVIGQSGSISLNTNQFTVKENGEIYIADRLIDKIQLAGFNNVENLRKEGNNLYSNTDPNDIIDGNAKIKQGFLESSNTDSIKNMVDMLEVYRSYETNQSAIKILDGTLGRAVNEIGKV